MLRILVFALLRRLYLIFYKILKKLWRDFIDSIVCQKWHRQKHRHLLALLGVRHQPWWHCHCRWRHKIIGSTSRHYVSRLIILNRSYMNLRYVDKGCLSMMSRLNWTFLSTHPSHQIVMLIYSLKKIFYYNLHNPKI